MIPAARLSPRWGRGYSRGVRICHLCFVMALALWLGRPGLARAGMFDENVSQPPGGASARALPPAEADEVRRLQKAAEELRQKADQMRVRADALRDRKREDTADEFDDRAAELEDKARLFEDEADHVMRHGAKVESSGGVGPLKRPSVPRE